MTGNREAVLYLKRIRAAERYGVADSVRNAGGLLRMKAVIVVNGQMGTGVDFRGGPRANAPGPSPETYRFSGNRRTILAAAPQESSDTVRSREPVSTALRIDVCQGSAVSECRDYLVRGVRATRPATATVGGELREVNTCLLMRHTFIGLRTHWHN